MALVAADHGHEPAPLIIGSGRAGACGALPGVGSVIMGGRPRVPVGAFWWPMIVGSVTGAVCSAVAGPRVMITFPRVRLRHLRGTHGGARVEGAVPGPGP
ncbi:hypothetical protein GCM10010464_28380 [Pseudonocardia yunnanensis]|uniref:Uncharacterized protein n=1 Tax=Pseudonocardia yunnanensis TaxID=58107 RepID=A0ABW4EWL5_9PSEU